MRPERRLDVVALVLILEVAPVLQGTVPLRRGDANRDGAVQMSDAVFTRGFLLLGRSAPICHDAVDANDAPGADPTDDQLDCKSATGPFSLDFQEILMDCIDRIGLGVVIEEQGFCTPFWTRDVWVLIPRLPDDYSVRFEIEVVRTPDPRRGSGGRLQSMAKDPHDESREGHRRRLDLEAAGFRHPYHSRRTAP